MDTRSSSFTVIIMPGRTEEAVHYNLFCRAIKVATRVAEERGAILGDEIGYLIRFDNCCDDKRTRVKVCSFLLFFCIFVCVCRNNH